jgi:hypothetical protein
MLTNRVQGDRFLTPAHRIRASVAMSGTKHSLAKRSHYNYLLVELTNLAFARLRA